MDIKRSLTKLVHEKIGESTDAKSLAKTYNQMWQNIRKKPKGGLRLTDEGFRLMTEVLDVKTYDVTFPKDLTITNQVAIWLDRFIDCPYYISKKSIVVFTEKMAVQLFLFSGDVQKFGLAKAMNGELSSDTI